MKLIPNDLNKTLDVSLNLASEIEFIPSVAVSASNVQNAIELLNTQISNSKIKTTFEVIFADEDTTQFVTINNINITVSSIIIIVIDSEEAAILELTGKLISVSDGSCEIVIHAPNGASGTYNGYIIIM